MDNNFSTAHLISEQVFENWSIDWKNLEHDTNPYQFFKGEQGVLYGVVFSSGNMSSLLSTTGVSTVKIRFGFDKENATFQIILFGTDNTGQVMTPYYVPAKNLYYEKNDLADEQGRVPAELIRQWKQNWIAKAAKGNVTYKNFMTPYGFTRGYNYPLTEFIEALFTFQTAPDINIIFVLHEYYGIDYLTTKETTSTFGVVLHGTKTASTTNLMDDPDGYYDLTAPCPRTC